MTVPNALKVKEWCVETISSSGWTMIASRAYPEILMCESKVSILNLNKNSTFSEEHIEILNKYMVEVYGLEIPVEISHIEPKIHPKSNLKVEWVDNVSGKMKMSFTFQKPSKWFSRLIGKE